MVLNNAAAAFIGAAVTLVLVIIFMILMVILVRQCLAFLAKRSAVRAQMEAQRQARVDLERQRRGSITEPVPATFDWHHSIRVAGTPPPSYHEAKQLPAFEEAIVAEVGRKVGRERGDGTCSEVSDPMPGLGSSNDSDESSGGCMSRPTDVAEQRHVMVSILVEGDVVSNGSGEAELESGTGAEQDGGQEQLETDLAGQP